MINLTHFPFSLDNDLAEQRLIRVIFIRCLRIILTMEFDVLSVIGRVKYLFRDRNHKTVAFALVGRKLSLKYST